jgi:hypothetical protein
VNQNLALIQSETQSKRFSQSRNTRTAYGKYIDCQQDHQRVVTMNQNAPPLGRILVINTHCGSIDFPASQPGGIEDAIIVRILESIDAGVLGFGVVQTTIESPDSIRGALDRGAIHPEFGVIGKQIESRSARPGHAIDHGLEKQAFGSGRTSSDFGTISASPTINIQFTGRFWQRRVGLGVIGIWQN